jgi:hypothetical protein
MCRGEDHGDDERRMMPAFSRVRNSASANRSFSESRRRALAKTGRLVVSTEWRTPCNGRGEAFPSPMIDGKAARRGQTAGVMWHNAAENLDGKAATALLEAYTYKSIMELFTPTQFQFKNKEPLSK